MSAPADSRGAVTRLDLGSIAVNLLKDEKTRDWDVEEDLSTQGLPERTKTVL
jgi:hypothetical protein